jgi:hypothetical protein
MVLGLCDRKVLVPHHDTNTGTLCRPESLIPTPPKSSLTYEYECAFYVSREASARHMKIYSLKAVNKFEPQFFILNNLRT